MSKGLKTFGEEGGDSDWLFIILFGAKTIHSSDRRTIKSWLKLNDWRPDDVIVENGKKKKIEECDCAFHQLTFLQTLRHCSEIWSAVSSYLKLQRMFVSRWLAPAWGESSVCDELRLKHRAQWAATCSPLQSSVHASYFYEREICACPRGTVNIKQLFMKLADQPGCWCPQARLAGW